MAAAKIATRYPGIYARGSRFVATWRDPSGRQVERSAATITEAKAIRSAMQADVARAEYTPRSALTFAAYAADWISGYQGRSAGGVKPETIADYRRLLGIGEDGQPVLDAGRWVNAIAAFGKLRLSEIEPQHVKSYIRQLQARGLAPGSIRLYLAPVKAALAEAVELGLIRSNPTTAVRIPNPRRLADDDGERVKALTDDQLDQLIEATPERWRFLIVFLSETGLRIGEALALEWSDIDLDAARLTVRRRIYRGRIDTPKSARGRRSVPLSGHVVEQLRERRGIGQALVFPSRTGGHLNPANLHGRTLKPAARAAGVEWVGFHTLRHTAGSRMFAEGWNVLQVSAVLGHSDAAFTTRVYLHDVSGELPASPFTRQAAAQ